MGILFSPGPCPQRRPVLFDMRVALATDLSKAKKRGRRTRSVSVDFRVCHRVVGEDAFVIQDGDRVTLVLEDDGSWIFNNVGPDGEGYVVRASTSKSDRGGVRFRMTMTYAQAIDLFAGQQEGMDYTFVGAEKNKAYFAPVRSRQEFSPSRNGHAVA